MMMQGLLWEMSEAAYTAGVSLHDLVFVTRRQYLITALKANNLNQVRTAAALGIHRNTLARGMSESQINLAALRDEMKDEKKAAASVKPSAAAVSNAG